MDKDKQIKYWLTGAEHDWETAGDIYDSGKNFHFCLFLCHLVIEKLLKALAVKAINDFPPKTHNLLRLAELAGLQITPDDIKLLEELNKFQMDTRYPDEKFTLYKMATLEFTTERILKIEMFRKWLISQILK
ncbi:MAG: HEPN domain-containing protein [Ignavibacteria bacterium]